MEPEGFDDFYKQTEKHMQVRLWNSKAGIIKTNKMLLLRNQGGAGKAGHSQK